MHKKRHPLGTFLTGTQSGLTFCMGRQWRKPLPACSLFCLDFVCSVLTTPVSALPSASAQRCSRRTAFGTARWPSCGWGRSRCCSLPEIWHLSHSELAKIIARHPVQTFVQGAVLLYSKKVSEDMKWRCKKKYYKIEVLPLLLLKRHQ